PEFDLYDEGQPIYTNARMLPPAKIQDAHIRNSMIGEASVVIGATVEDSVVGIRSFIGAGAVVRRSVLLGADFFPWHDPTRRDGAGAPDEPGIGERTVVENAIIDKNAQIGPDCRIVNAHGVDEAEGDGWVIRDGIVVVRKNAVLPPGTIV
ncbi:MAG TPA: glucose-1-phosphate adenylyltransferase, partial [Rubricoccaceae bacterium]